MHVLISAGEAPVGGELASLRSWLDSPDADGQWELAAQRPSGGTLGIGADEILAIISAIEGLPVLVQWIQSWRTTRQEPPPVTVTIVIGAPPGDGDGHQLPDGGQATQAADARPGNAVQPSP